MSYKLIYLARRNPKLSEDEFPEAWRSHSRLASTLSNTMGKHFVRVMQCIKAYGEDVPPEYINNHDGTALITMKSWEDLVAGRSHPDALKVMHADEPRVFADYVANWTMAAKETSLLEKSEGRSALVHFIARRHDVSPEEFASEWSEAHAQRIQQLGVVRDRAQRFALNEVIEAPAPPYDFAAVSELWFDSVEEARRAAWDDDHRAAWRALDNVADPARSAALLVRINFEKAKVTDAAGQAVWDAS